MLISTRTLFAVLVAGLLVASPLCAQEPDMPFEVEVQPFTDEELIDGFMKTAFGSESRPDSPLAKMLHRYEGRIKVFMHGDREREMEHARAYVRQLSELLPGVRIALAKRANEATIDVYFMSVRRDGNSDAWIEEADAIITQRFGRRSKLAKTDKSSMKSAYCFFFPYFNDDHSTRSTLIFIPQLSSEQHLEECIIEEIQQSLGTRNDNSSLKKSIFSDDNPLGQTQLFDLHLISMLYHPSLRSGMRAKIVRKRLPTVIKEVRKHMEAVAVAISANVEARKPRFAAQQGGIRFLSMPLSDREIIAGFRSTAFGAPTGWDASSQGRKLFRMPAHVRYFMSDFEPAGILRARRIIDTLHLLLPQMGFAAAASEEDAHLVLLSAIVGEEDVVNRKAIKRHFTGAVGRLSAERFYRSNGCQIDILVTTASSEIERSIAVVPWYYSDLLVRRCILESIVRSLGFVGATSRLRSSIFNTDAIDDDMLIVDAYFLAILYHEDLQPGMTWEIVEPKLPAILRDVRSRFARFGVAFQ